MNTVLIVLAADLESAPLGTRSRLADDIHGMPQLRRVARAALRALPGAGLLAVAPAEHRAKIETLLDGIPHAFQPGACEPRPGIRQARRAAMGAWRAGIGGAFVHEEEHAFLAVARAPALHPGVRALVFVPAHAALVDRPLLSGMVRGFLDDPPVEGLRITGAPPGFHYAVYSPEAVRQAAELGACPVHALRLNLEEGSRDIELTGMYHRIPARHVAPRGRFLVDTERGVERCDLLLKSRALAEGHSPLEAAARLEDECPHALRGRLPRFVTAEVFLDSSAANTNAAGRNASQVAHMPPAAFQRMVDELGTYDDACLFLGGLGDGLGHPETERLLIAARRAGVFGLFVETSGERLDERLMDTLIDVGVDAVVLRLAAPTRAGDKRTMAETTALRLRERVRERGAPGPIVVPAITKDLSSLPDLQDSFVYWSNATGAALVRPPRRETEPKVIALHLSPRETCLRLTEQLYVLPDGTVPLCIAESAGPGEAVEPRVVGHVGKQSLEEIWNSRVFRDHIDAHRRREFSRRCGDCELWDSLC